MLEKGVYAAPPLRPRPYRSSAAMPEGIDCSTGRCEVIFGTPRELSSVGSDSVSKIMFRRAEDNSGPRNGDNSWPFRTLVPQVELAGPRTVPGARRATNTYTIHTHARARAHNRPVERNSRAQLERNSQCRMLPMGRRNTESNRGRIR